MNMVVWDDHHYPEDLSHSFKKTLSETQYLRQLFPLSFIFSISKVVFWSRFWLQFWFLQNWLRIHNLQHWTVYPLFVCHYMNYINFQGILFFPFPTEFLQIFQDPRKLNFVKQGFRANFFCLLFHYEWSS